MGDKKDQLQDRTADTTTDTQPDKGAGAALGKAVSGPQADQLIQGATAQADSNGPALITGPGALPGGAALTPLQPKVAAFGEQIVGSTNSQTIHAPWNTSKYPVIANFTLSGDGFSFGSNTQTSLTLSPSSSISTDEMGYIDKVSPTIVFRPMREGEFHGVLTLTASNGEVQTVALQASARTLSEVPSNHDGPVETDDPAHAQRHAHDVKEDEAAMAAEKKAKPVYNPDFDGAIRQAAESASLLSDAQDRGLGIVEKEVSAYEKLVQKADRSIWWDIAEVALTMATAGVAAVVAKNLLPKVLGTVEDKLVDGVMKPVMIPAKLGEFWTDSIKEGLKTAGKSAIKNTVGIAGGPKKHDDPDTDVGAHSTNRRIDFFAQQSAILSNQKGENFSMIENSAKHLRPLLRTDPESAVKMLEQTKGVFDGETAAAEQAQANAVTPQWATFVARMQLGAEMTNTAAEPTKKVEATKTDALRPQTEGKPNPVDGVLDIFVANEFHQDITGATLHGASQSFADRIAGLKLVDAQMPIRFVISPNDARPTIVTRDEAGRVRVSEEAESARINGHTEPDQVGKMTAMIDRLLSTSLRGQGISIKTDDANAGKL